MRAITAAAAARAAVRVGPGRSHWQAPVTVTVLLAPALAGNIEHEHNLNTMITAGGESSAAGRPGHSDDSQIILSRPRHWQA